MAGNCSCRSYSFTSIPLAESSASPTLLNGVQLSRFALPLPSINGSIRLLDFKDIAPLSRIKISTLTAIDPPDNHGALIDVVIDSISQAVADNCSFTQPVDGISLSVCSTWHITLVMEFCEFFDKTRSREVQFCAPCEALRRPQYETIQQSFLLELETPTKFDENLISIFYYCWKIIGIEPEVTLPPFDCLVGPIGVADLQAGLHITTSRLISFDVPRLSTMHLGLRSLQTVLSASTFDCISVDNVNSYGGELSHALWSELDGILQTQWVMDGQDSILCDVDSDYWLYGMEKLSKQDHDFQLTKRCSLPIEIDYNHSDLVYNLSRPRSFFGSRSRSIARYGDVEMATGVSYIPVPASQCSQSMDQTHLIEALAREGYMTNFVAHRLSMIAPSFVNRLLRSADQCPDMSLLAQHADTVLDSKSFELILSCAVSLVETMTIDTVTISKSSINTSPPCTLPSSRVDDCLENVEHAEVQHSQGEVEPTSRQESPFMDHALEDRSEMCQLTVEGACARTCEPNLRDSLEAKVNAVVREYQCVDCIGQNISTPIWSVVEQKPFNATAELCCDLCVLVNEQFLEAAPNMFALLSSRFGLKLVDCALENEVSLIVDANSAIFVVSPSDDLRLKLRQIADAVLKFCNIWVLVCVEDITFSPISAEFYRNFVRFPATVSCRLCLWEYESLAEEIACSVHQTCCSALKRSSWDGERLRLRPYLSLIQSSPLFAAHCSILQLFPTINYFVAAQLLSCQTLQEVWSCDLETIEEHLSQLNPRPELSIVAFERFFALTRIHVGLIARVE